MSTTTQAPTTGERRGNASPVAGHHIDTLDKPAAYDPDLIGWYGLEATTCWLCLGTGQVDDGDRLCPQCLGGGVV